MGFFTGILQNPKNKKGAEAPFSHSLIEVAT